MEKTSLPSSSSTMINPTDIINNAMERISEHLAIIRVVKDTKVWWDCYQAIWEQLNYIHEPNIEAFINWLNWGMIIHSDPEELAGHQWGSLGVEPQPCDLEVPEREKLWSNDVPGIGEDLWGVGQSIEKGKGKKIPIQLLSGGGHVLGHGHLPMGSPPQVIAVTHHLSPLPLWYPVHPQIPKPPLLHKLCKKGSYIAQVLWLHPSNTGKPKWMATQHDSIAPSEGGTLGTTSCTSCSQYSNWVEELESQVVDLTQRVRMSDAHLEAQEREMNIMCDMMEDMCTYIVHGSGGSADEHPTIFSVPSAALPSPPPIFYSSPNQSHGSHPQHHQYCWLLLVQLEIILLMGLVVTFSPWMFAQWWMLSLRILEVMTTCNLSHQGVPHQGGHLIIQLGSSFPFYIYDLPTAIIFWQYQEG
ncbi:hypothetical protein EDC04DRAFT_2604714 [Pisolithus marmoratus]|nr:hypothetical protein EDC04DRAFT_2604714 [Pisolithus marmoratus]